MVRGEQFGEPREWPLSRSGPLAADVIMMMNLMRVDNKAVFKKW